MRYVILMFMLMWVTLPLHAEEQILLHGKLDNGVYGAPVLKITSVDGSSSVLIGAQGGWVVGHTFVIGLGGYGLASQHEYSEPGEHNAPGYGPYDHRRLDLGYGGILLSYINQSDKLVHGTVDLLIGGGTISMSKRYPYDDEWGEYDHNSGSDYSDGFFVLEPTVSAEVNVLKFMRFDAGIGYRWVSGVSRFGYSNADISGVTGTLAVKFGKF